MADPVPGRHWPGTFGGIGRRHRTPPGRISAVHRLRRSPGAGWGIAKLLLLNGPPGVGKTTVARRYVNDRPLALHLEVDAIRVSLGQWQHHDESKLLARALAVAMAEAHLRGGRDVVVAQYLGRLEFIDQLDGLAQRLGADFVEVVLLDAPEAVVDRFRARRAELAAPGRAHPEGDIDEPSVPQLVAQSFELLAAVRGVRPWTHVISAEGGAESAYRALRGALATPDPPAP